MDEEELIRQEKKESRQLRKILSYKDRSKFKKTEKSKSIIPSLEGTIRGRVVSIDSQGVIVESLGSFYLCSLKGALKKEKKRLKNLVIVGDFVFFQKQVTSGLKELLYFSKPLLEGVIVHVDQRSSILSRSDNLSRQKEQLIAANIDLVFITVSVVEPRLRPSLVDRYLIAAKRGNLTPVVLVTKIDLLEDNEDEKHLYLEFIQQYQKAGVEVLSLSLNTQEGVDLLKKRMDGNTSVFSGQSGVGKTSLINALTASDFKVKKVVSKTKKGSHTTTRATLLPLEQGGFCIDTPGIKSFEIWNLEKQEIESYFSEFLDFKQECHFHNCSHTHEKGCRVKEAVENEEISFLRYQSYLLLIEGIEKEHQRR